MRLSTKIFIKDYYYFFIPVLVLIISYLRLISDPVLGITPDSKDYIKIANDLPKITKSLFPIFYPVVIKIANFFLNDYFIATKSICIISLFVTFYYPYKNKFFWKELWGICSFPAFLNIYYYSWSETIFIPLIIIFIHLNYNYLEKNKNKHFLIKNTLLILLLLLTKYSAIGILAGYMFSIIIISLRSKKIYKEALISIILSSILFLIYLLINHYCTGDYTGARIAAVKEKMNIRYSFFRIIYNLNPIISDRMIFDFKINYILLAIFTALFYFPFLKIKLKWDNNKSGFVFMSCGICFLLLTIFSYFTTKLDNLDSRLLMPFLLFLLFSIVTFVYKHQNLVKIKKIRIALLITIYISLIINLMDTTYKMINHPSEKTRILQQVKNLTY